MVSLPPPFSPSTNSTTTTAHNPNPATKPPTTRLAIARATIRFSNPTSARLIQTSSLQKGDVLAVARIAGIMAAKRTADLIPLCHNIPLAGVELDVVVVGGSNPGSTDTSKAADDKSGATFQRPRPAAEHYADPAPVPLRPAQESPHRPSDKDGQAIPLPPTSTDYDIPRAESEPVGPHGGVVVTAKVQCHGQTGVEMEALTAASVAALTVYDMCKAVDRGMRVEGLRVMLKTGGRSGAWREGVGVGSGMEEEKGEGARRLGAEGVGGLMGKGRGWGL